MTDTTTPMPIAFLDTETTSLRKPWMPGGRRIWDIAVMRREPDGEVKQYTAIVTDVDLRDADPFSLQIGHFDERWSRDEGVARTFDLEGGGNVALMRQPEHIVMERVAKLTAGALVVGSNPGFDMEGIEHAHYRLGMRPPSWHYHPCDITDLALGNLAVDTDISEHRWKSDTLARLCGVKPLTDELRHTAWGDVTWTANWWDMVLSAGTFPQR